MKKNFRIANIETTLYPGDRVMIYIPDLEYKEFIVSQIDAFKFALISVKDGNRWYAPVSMKGSKLKGIPLRNLVGGVNEYIQYKKPVYVKRGKAAPK